MIRKTRLIVTLGVAAVVTAGVARGAEIVRTEYVSHRSFDHTIKRLEWGFGGYGITVVAQLDYPNVLRKARAQVRPARMFEVLRRPWVKAVFDSDVAAALDIPLRIYVSQRDDGKTVVRYYRPSSVFEAYGKDSLRKLGVELDAVLDEIVRVATGRGDGVVTRRGAGVE
jgi:uncharacterized protein (DUF302 family)